MSSENKYFDLFNRCKFGSFCSFAYRTSQKGSNEELHAKVFDLDKRVEELEKDIKQANLKITNLSEENENLENKLESAMQSFIVVCKIILKKATDSIIEINKSREVITDYTT